MKFILIYHSTPLGVGFAYDVVINKLCLRKEEDRQSLWLWRLEALLL